MPLLKVIAIVTLIALLPSWVAMLIASSHKSPHTSTPTGIVFGAGVLPNGTPTSVLRQRLLRAVDLYNLNIIKTILVSGDNRRVEYNEPLAMKSFLISNDIPENSIIEDFGGRNTRDTCWRAYNVFGVRKAILITQHFHIPRAHSLCSLEGIESFISPVSSGNLSVKLWGSVRDIIATPVNHIQVFAGYSPEIKKDGSERQIDAQENI